LEASVEINPFHGNGTYSNLAAPDDSGTRVRVERGGAGPSGGGKQAWIGQSGAFSVESLTGTGATGTIDVALTDVGGVNHPIRLQGRWSCSIVSSTQSPSGGSGPFPSATHSP
jgi:hypothetical protein